MWKYYLFAVIVHLIFLLFCFFDNNGVIMLIELIMQTVLIPVYLIIVSTKFFNEFSILKFILILIAMLFTEIVGVIFVYFNWGISTGNLLKPDSETILIIKLQIIISSIIILVCWCVVGVIKSKKFG